MSQAHLNLTTDAALVAEADIVPLAMSLVQMSGETELVTKLAPFVKGPWDYLQSIPAGLCAEIRQRASAEIKRIAAGGMAMLATIDDDSVLQQMLSVAVGEHVDLEYVSMARSQMSPEHISPRVRKVVELQIRADPEVIIVGAGVSGLCQAYILKKAGIGFVILEKNSALGGTWLENTYPGCAVDTPNHFYEYTFFQNDDWPKFYSDQATILQYLEDFARSKSLLESIQFDTEVERAEFDGNTSRWNLTCRTAGDGLAKFSGRFLVTAVGQLNRASIPAIPGLAEFAGETIHTSAWHDGCIDGKRVAIIGTGASAVQVGPAIADRVAHLTVMQRSGGWVTRVRNVSRRVTEGKKRALADIPFYGNWYRFQMFWAFADGLYPVLLRDPDWDDGGKSINSLNSKMRNRMLSYIHEKLEGRPDLIEKVTPPYPPFGKRVLADAGWYDMLLRDNVSLETDSILSIEPAGIKLEDGRLVPVETIVLATGFQAGRMLWPIDIIGEGGATIRDAWGDSDPSAYLGMTVPGFPNMFVMYGPNTGVGHGGSVMFLAECQSGYILKCIEMVNAAGGSTICVKQEVHNKYRADVDQAMQGLVWSHPSVSSWYKNSNGRIIINQPDRLVDYWAKCQSPNLEDFLITS